MKLSILMPAYDEERTITQAIDGVLSAKYPCDIELIVVDDGSTDHTAILRDPRVCVYRHHINRGKGAAVLSAVSSADRHAVQRLGEPEVQWMRRVTAHRANDDGAEVSALAMG